MRYDMHARRADHPTERLLDGIYTHTYLQLLSNNQNMSFHERLREFHLEISPSETVCKGCGKGIQNVQ